MSTVNIFDMADTWNDAAVDFRAIRMNVTNTASGAGSLLMEMLLNSAHRLSLRHDGVLSISNFCNAEGYRRPSLVGAQIDGQGVHISSGEHLSFTAGLSSGSKDIFLARDAPGILAQRHASNPQTLRLYNTITNPSNHERGTIGWVSNTLRIGTEHEGTGVARPLSLMTGGTERVHVAANGLVGIGVAPGVNSTTLTVAGSSLSQAPLLITSVDSAMTERAGIQFNYSNGTSLSSLRVARISTRVRAGGGGDLWVQTASSAGGNFTTRLAVSRDGNIGIGTVEPAALLDLATTWNDGATTFQGMCLNVTDTTSGSDSKMLNLLVSNTSIFNVSKTGRATATQFVQQGAIATSKAIFNSAQGITYADIEGTNNDSNPVGKLTVYSSGSSRGFISGATAGLIIRSTSARTLALHTAFEAGLTLLQSTLEHRDGGNPQSYNVYNTFTNDANYERGFFGWSSNALRIGTEHAGTGNNRPIQFRTNGALRMTIGESGTVSFSTPVSFSNSTYLAADSAHFWTGRSYIASPADGVIRLMNSAATGFDRLQFGGVTSAFPAIKQVGANLAVRLADDSDYSDLEIHENLYFGDQLTSPRLRALGSVLDVVTRDATAFAPLRVGALQLFSDVILAREGADLLALRRSTNPQTLRLYNTHTDAANYERGFMRWDTGIFEIGTERAGTGIARTMVFRTNGTNRFMIGSTGTVTFTIPAGQTFKLAGLPTSDPLIAGALWDDGGTLKVSAG